MDGIQVFQDFLASGADAAMVVFAFLLWKMDRRMLVVEMNLKHIWRKIAVNHDHEAELPTE